MHKMSYHLCIKGLQLCAKNAIEGLDQWSNDILRRLCITLLLSVIIEFKQKWL